MRRLFFMMGMLLASAGMLSAEPVLSDDLSAWTPEKAQIHLDMGTSVMSHVGSSVFVRPTIVKQISPRLAIAASLRYAQYNLKPLPWQTYQAGDGASVQMSVAGICQLSDKWKVWGAVTHQQSDLRFGPEGGTYDLYTLGAQYHPNENLWITAELNVAHGMLPFWYPCLYDGPYAWALPGSPALCPYMY